MAVGDKVEGFHKAIKTLRDTTKEVTKIEGKAGEIPADYKAAVKKLQEAVAAIPDLYAAQLEAMRDDFRNRQS